MIIINLSESYTFGFESSNLSRNGRIISSETNGRNKIIAEFEDEKVCKRVFLDILESYNKGKRVYNIKQELEIMNERED